MFSLSFVLYVDYVCVVGYSETVRKYIVYGTPLVWSLYTDNDL